MAKLFKRYQTLAQYESDKDNVNENVICFIENEGLIAKNKRIFDGGLLDRVDKLEKNLQLIVGDGFIKYTAKIFRAEEYDNGSWKDGGVLHYKLNGVDMISTDTTFTIKSLSSLKFNIDGNSSMSETPSVGNQYIETLDLSWLDTSNIVDMQSMFSSTGSNDNGLVNITSLNLNGINTSNVTTMMNMFGKCKSLTSLDLSSFDTSKVTNMAFMFSGCTKLEILDLSNFDMSNITNDETNEPNILNMFHECTSLKEIKCNALFKEYCENNWASMIMFGGPKIDSITWNIN